MSGDAWRRVFGQAGDGRRWGEAMAVCGAGGGTLFGFGGLLEWSRTFFFGVEMPLGSVGRRLLTEWTGVRWTTGPLGQRAVVEVDFPWTASLVGAASRAMLPPDEAGEVAVMRRQESFLGT